MNKAKRELIMQLNSTDHRNVFLERANKSNNIFGKFSLGVKTP